MRIRRNVVGILSYGALCCAPLFVLGDETTNAPGASILAPASASSTNRPTHAGAPTDDSLDSLRQKAEAGDAPSQFLLGLKYLSGIGIQKDAVEAAKWFRKSADQGNANAQAILGMAYALGKGVEKDADQAALWFRKAADQGNPNAQVCLANCYAEGTGVVKDAAEAAKWFHKAADQGNPDGQYCLGVAYANGTGVEKNVSEAAKWYRMAADQGYALAQYNLGVYYREGTGVDKDPVEAVNWFRKAADQGVALAEQSLGACYANGEGVKKDMVEALKWHRKAANQGDVISQYVVGASYEYGIGVDKDPVIAVKWLSIAAAQGNAGAQLELGVCYATGVGAKKDMVEAAKWYRLAAEQGDAVAEQDLGACYTLGQGVEKNPGEGSKWLLKAAEQGNSTAQYFAGLMYTQGIGVIKNEVEGMAWLYVSSANGNESAVKAISTGENIYSAPVIQAARQRATELQTQIASQNLPARGDSAAAMPQPVPAPNAPKESGSGAFITSSGLVLTAAHVVQSATRIEVVSATGTLAATVVKIDTTNDVALLKCTGSNFIPLPIASSKEARAGTTVFTVGFPNIQIQGFDPKLTSGEISSQTGFQDDPRQWQISVPTQPGNSGGPLCDENGNLIGIIESTLNPLTMAKIAGEIPQNVNYAVKSSYILPLLDGVQNLPPPVVSSSGTKFVDTVSNVQKSVVLILVY